MNLHSTHFKCINDKKLNLFSPMQLMGRVNDRGNLIQNLQLAEQLKLADYFEQLVCIFLIVPVSLLINIPCR